MSLNRGFSVFRRICRTRTSTGTRPASSATGAECPWWTNSSAARRTRFTAATATIPNSLAAAMDAARSSVLVRKQCDFLNFKTMNLKKKKNKKKKNTD